MYTRRIILVACILTILWSCYTTTNVVKTESSELPAKLRLEYRIREFHKALGSNDIFTWYSMTSPYFQTRVSLEQFKKNLRWDENMVRRPQKDMKGELSRNCGCVQDRYLRCALIVDIMETEKNGFVKKENPLETWEYHEGEWFWAYMGPSAGGLCPGERH